MKTLKIAVGLALLCTALAGCAANTNGLYASGDYYNSFGRDYYEPYQDGESYHYHHSYFANAEAVDITQ
jgi:hypothetical protein